MRKNIFLLLTLCLMLVSGIKAQKSEIIIPTGHSYWVTSVAFSPDGKYIVSGSCDNTCKLWDVNTGKEIRTFEGHSNWVNSVAFSPDGKYIVSGSFDRTIILWDVNTGKEIRTFEGHSNRVNSVAFSPDGKCIVSGSSDSTCKLWDVNTGKEIRSFEGHSSTIFSVAFSSDGQYLVSGSADNTIKLWDVNTGEEIRTFEGHSNWVYSVAFSPDGKYIVSGSYDNTCKLWDVNTGKGIRTFKEHLRVHAVAFSPDGKNLVSGSADNTIKLWDVNTGEEIKTLEGHTKCVYSLVFSPDGKYIVSASEDNLGKLWDVNTGVEIRTFGPQINRISFVEQNNSLILATGSNLINIDINTLNILRIQETKKNNMFFENIASNYLVSHSNDSMQIYDINLNLLYEFKNKGDYVPAFNNSTNNFIKQNYSEDANHLYSYSLETGKTIAFKGHSKRISKVIYSPDGKYIATSSYDGTIKLWNIKTGKEIKTLEAFAAYGIAFSPDSKYLAFSNINDETVKLWNINTDKKVRTFDDSKVTSVAFSLDGKYLVSGNLDKNLTIWDVNTGKKIKTFKGHSDMVRSVAFSPDGKYLISRSRDDIGKIWDVNSGMELTSFPFGSYNKEMSLINWSQDNSHVIINSGNSVFVYNLKEKEEVNRFEKTNFTEVTYSEDKMYIFATNRYFIKLINALTYQEIATYYSIGESGYVVTAPDGRFDASADAIKKMYYVKGMEIIPLESYFEQFYTPNLWAKVLQGEGVEDTELDINDMTLPPLVKIISPNIQGDFRGFKTINDLLYSENQNIQVAVQATDKGGGIDEIRIYHNDKLLDGTQRGFKPVARDGARETKTFTIALVNGENRIRATAFNTQRTESTPHEIVVGYTAPQQVKPNMYIFAIGIDEYLNPRYNLNYAKNDAGAFAKALQSGAGGIFDKVIVTNLSDDKATREGIMAEIDKINRVVRQEDVFVFYYAGHGVMSSGRSSEKPEFFLIPHDVTRMYEADDMLKSKGISAKEIGGFSKNIRSQKQLFVLDACQSGGAMQTLAMRGASEEKALAQLSRSTGTYFIAASGTEQFATEVATLGHGIFTYSILEAFKGVCKSQDGRLTVNLLKGCIEDLVPELSKQYKGQPQFPTGYGFGQDFPIGIVK